MEFGENWRTWYILEEVGEMNMTWIDTITVVISVLLGIGICFLPNSASEWIATKASLHSFGIRNLPRKNDKTDTLANMVLFFLLVFSCTYWLIPDITIAYILYSLLYLISCFLLLAQCCRISKSYSEGHHLAFFLAMALMMVLSYISAMSVFNGHQVVDDLLVFRKHLAHNELFEILYYFQNHEIFSVILQGLLFFSSFYMIWAQFKYMRLESNYKARNIVFLWIKVLFVCAIMLGLSWGGYALLDMAYYVKR